MRSDRSVDLSGLTQAPEAHFSEHRSDSRAGNTTSGTNLATMVALMEVPLR
jgi:hypothetical protein